MRRAFKNKLCAYCGQRPATAGDHVIAREFFPIELRANLPQVPVCAVCNSLKSDYERYAMAVFPFGSTHQAGAEMLKTKVKSRLENDQRLSRALRERKIVAFFTDPSGAMVQREGIPFDADRAEELFRLIVRGLFWYHYSIALPSSYSIPIFWFTEDYLAQFVQMISTINPNKYRDDSIADGAFRYQHTLCPDDPLSSGWILDFYSGLNMFGITDKGELLPVSVAAMTGPEGIADFVSASLNI